MSTRRSQQPIELILLRQLASYLSTPIFVVDTDASLIFFNEAAAPLLGGRFDEMEAMSRDEWLTVFAPRELDGRPVDPSGNPLLAALTERREQHRTLTIRDVSGDERTIEATAIPLEGQAGRLLGAVAIFWPAAGR